MKIKPAASLVRPDQIETDLELNLTWADETGLKAVPDLPPAYAYPPLVNSHDHLIGNWVPRSGDHRPYPNSYLWVEDMQQSFAIQERNNFWINDGKGDFTGPEALTLARLGCYKNLFSGCGLVADHGPVQPAAYYDQLPLPILRKYRQCHSLQLNNWWGGKTGAEEYALTKGKQPFIIHLSEGTDKLAKSEFAALKKQNLLQPNLLIIHGIALTRAELKEIASIGASICWCPTSNLYLIGSTLDVNTCLELGVNVVLGTDSTQTGSINMLDEFANAHTQFPDVSLSVLFRMMNFNAYQALNLPSHSLDLNPADTRNLLLVDALEHEPLENLLEIGSENIQLLLCQGKPLYGDAHWLGVFPSVQGEYIEFRVGKRLKFVLGDPLALNDQIDAVLGYHKDFPFLPF